MTWDSTDEVEVKTELDAIEGYINECDAKIRNARPIRDGLYSILEGKDFDGSEMDATRRDTLKTSLIAKSKVIRG